ncbi:MAG TPA: tetratricopeptide repeat protein [Anaerolineales bacterium]|nr:tetratricopeptide repeat protein [Anaerolineales bacterium]
MAPTDSPPGPSAADAETIRQVSTLIRAGRIEDARPLLARLLQRNPQSEEGWLLLSMTVKDRQKQIDCLNQVLRINPDHQLAKSRIAKLSRPPTEAPTTGAVPPLLTTATTTPPPASVAPPFLAGQPPAAPSSEKQGWRPYDAPLPEEPQPVPAQPARRAPPQRGRGCVVVMLSLMGLGVLAGLGYVIFQSLTAETPRAANPTELAGLLNTLPPTWTPTITPTITETPTPRPTATITLTPSPIPPDATTVADMEIIQREVADVRGLDIRDPAVPRYVVSKARVRPILEASFLAGGGTPEEVADQVTVLSSLGLLKPTYDLYTNALNGLTDSIGGFYFPWNHEVYVIGTRFGGVERWVFSHEFDHALVDQHYNIDAMGVYPLCQGDQQRCQAIRALVEGDATLAMNQWFQQYVRPQDVQDILNYKPPPVTLPEQFPPPYLYLDSAFPYTYGLEFVTQLYNRGRWARVNQAYENLPLSTEQIMHPEKYLANERPVEVAEVPVAQVLTDPAWHVVESNTLGEWLTYLILGYGADVDAQLNDETARIAATGWGGDRYQVYTNSENDESVLVVHWVWDSAIDASTFDRAMQEYMDKRYSGGVIDSPRGHCWEANAQVSCVYLNARDTVWLEAPTVQLVDQLRALFPAFR